MKWVKSFRKLSNLENERYDFENKKHSLIIIILLFAIVLLTGIDSLNRYTNPEYFDTTAYLGEANFISNHGGVINFLNLCFSGTYKQANQNPLYILLLTPFASTNISFFITAKLISAIIGLLAMVLLYIMAKKICGDMVASIAVLAMSFNIVFVEWSGIVACESLLVLFSTLCMYFVIKGFSNNKFWIHAGIFAGLAYLTKATGLFLLPGFLLSGVVVYKLKIFRNKYFWSFFVLFILVSSPLLVRNIIVYNNPIFNVNIYIAEFGREKVYNTKYSVYSPEIGASHWEFEKFQNNEGNLEKKSSYLEIFNIPNFANKILTESKLFLTALNVSAAEKFLSGKLNLLFSLFLFFMFIIGLVREKNKGAIIYIVTILLVFLVALSLVKPIARYFLPIIPFIWIYISLGFLVLLDLTNKLFLEKKLKVNIFSFVPYIMILFLTIDLGYILTNKSLSNPLKSVEYSENRVDLVKWLRINLDENDKYTRGPNLNWQLDEGTWLVPPTAAKEDLSKLNLFIKNHNIKYVVIGKNDLVQEYGNDFNELGKEYFNWDPVNGITSKKDIKNWVLVHKSKEKPVDYLVYKVINNS